jgi:hypothetical protein
VSITLTARCCPDDLSAPAQVTVALGLGANLPSAMATHLSKAKRASEMRGRIQCVTVCRRCQRFFVAFDITAACTLYALTTSFGM